MKEINLIYYFGKDVYTNTGVYIGKVIDLIFDLEEKTIISLVVTKINNNLLKNINGLLIPFRWIISIKDIVLIYDIILKQIKKKLK